MITSIQWQSEPSSFQLEMGTVDVWLIPLQGSAARVLAGRSLLSEDERVRADRFRYERDRDRFVTGRVQLRRLLGKYLERSPQDLQFTYGHHGKPGVKGLEFNLSHSEDWALLAVCGDRIVGVDLEKMRPMADLEKLTARFYAAGEHQRVLQASDRTLAFFRTWTCKEAYLKATGEGLGQLQQVEVLIQAQQPAQFVNPVEWDVQEIEPVSGYVGAIVAPGTGWRVRFWAIGSVED